MDLNHLRSALMDPLGFRAGAHTISGSQMSG